MLLLDIFLLCLFSILCEFWWMLILLFIEDHFSFLRCHMTWFIYTALILLLKSAILYIIPVLSFLLLFCTADVARVKIFYWIFIFYVYFLFLACGWMLICFQFESRIIFPFSPVVRWDLITVSLLLKSVIFWIFFWSGTFLLPSLSFNRIIPLHYFFWRLSYLKWSM